jgi:hypothetical protein
VIQLPGLECLQDSKRPEPEEFRLTLTFGSGHGVETLPAWVATTATESDYPVAASASLRTYVTFGRGWVFCRSVVAVERWRHGGAQRRRP